MVEGPSSRVVLLGASNLWRSFGTALDELGARGSSPLDVLATPWPGRSYGSTTRVLFRELPSIRECGVWRALDEREPLPLSAVLLDIGNDLAYGADAATVAGWVAECLESLARRGARGAIVRLPLQTLESVGWLRFDVTRALMFPGRRLELGRLVDDARALDARLVDLASEHGFALIELDAGWFGLDPIHWKRARSADVWARIAGAIAGTEQRALRPAARRRVAARFEAEKLFGRPRNAPQPSSSTLDGSRVSWY